MKKFVLVSKIFFKDLFLFLTFIVFLGYINYYIPLYKIDVYSGVEECIEHTVKMSPIFFVYFLFLSYEFFYKVKKSNVEETMKSTRKGVLSLYSVQFLFLILLLTISTIIVLFYNVKACYNVSAIYNSLDRKELLSQVFNDILLYIYCADILAIVMGWLTSLVFKRLFGYMIMTLYIFLSIGFWMDLSGIVVSLMPGMSENALSNIYYFFSIFPSFSYFDYNNFHYGVAALPYQFELVLFWVFICIGVVCIKLAVDKKCVKIIGYIFVIASFVSLVLYMQPSCIVAVGTESIIDSAQCEQYYYNLEKRNEPKEENGGFSITKYDLDLKINNVLNATAKLDIDNGELSEYKFTLYHGYRVSEILDGDGKKVSFSRDSDYLLLYNNGNDMSKITMKYSGYSNKYYSNTQGIMLLGIFTYYPRSGYKIVFDTNNYSTSNEFLDEPTEFVVSVDYKKEVFCNLDKNENGVFTGITDGLTLVSGLVKSEMYSDVELVYPYNDLFLCNEDSNREQMENFINNKDDEIDIRKIIMLPNLNEGNQSVLYSDYMTVVSEDFLAAYNENKEKGRISNKKLPLYNVYKNFTENEEIFNRFLEKEARDKIKFEEDAQEWKAEYEINTIFSQKAEAVGTEKLLRLTEEYLYNSDDNRSVIEFLDSID